MKNFLHPAILQPSHEMQGVNRQIALHSPRKSAIKRFEYSNKPVLKVFPVENHYMVDDILPELNGFTATHYITYVKQYFGTVDANRINNALGLDFVYEQCFAAKEYNLYGSSRLGTKKDTSLLLNTRFKASSIDSTGSFVKDVVYYNYVKEYDTFQTSRILAFKQFELSNHLGNVLATILDRRTLFDTVITSTDTIAIWDADIVGAQD